MIPWIYVLSRGCGPQAPHAFATRRDDVPTLNTSANTGRLFTVLSVEVFDLRCISTLLLSRCSALYTNDDRYNVGINVERLRCVEHLSRRSLV